MTVFSGYLHKLLPWCNINSWIKDKSEPVSCVTISMQCTIDPCNVHDSYTTQLTWRLEVDLMPRSIRKFNIPPPGKPPGHLNYLRLPCSNSLPSGPKSRSNAPPISTELPLLKDKFRLQSNTLHAFQRGICHNDTFKLLLKTLLKELFTNKGKIISCKSIKPCKNRKNSRAHYARTSDKSGSISPPFQRNIQIPPPPRTMHSQMPGVGPGGGGC